MLQCRINLVTVICHICNCVFSLPLLKRVNFLSNAKSTREYTEHGTFCIYELLSRKLHGFLARTILKYVALAICFFYNVQSIAIGKSSTAFELTLTFLSIKVTRVVRRATKKGALLHASSYAKSFINFSIVSFYQIITDEFGGFSWH